MKRVFAFSALLLSALVLSPLLPVSEADSISGRCRVIRMNDSVVEGDVTEKPDGSLEIKTRHGVVVTLKRNEIKSVVSLEDTQPKISSAAARADKNTKQSRTASLRREVSDDEVNEILSGIEITSSDVEENQDSDPTGSLPTNTESVEEMKRIAGSKANVLETKHFVFVYTSDKAAALALAARLESIYRWVYQYQKMMEIPMRKPEYRLEIFYFATHAEYWAYASTVGGIPEGAIGFYQPGNNRSAFFNLMTYPPIAQLLEFLKDKHVDPHVRQVYTNRYDRLANYLNLSVVQHEASHHIHHNTGVFSRDRVDLPTWCVEGLAQMFELPPGEAGGSLGATNHFRLNEFHQLYGNGGNGPQILKALDLRRFIVDDSQWQGGNSYSLGWALQHYLYKTHRKQYAIFMRKLAAREPDVEVSMTERQKEFEDLFGEVNDKWIEDFYKYIMGINLNRSILPD